MKRLIQLLFMTFINLYPLIILGQSEITIKGKVTNLTGKPIVNANISVVDASYGSSTNKDGQYIFKLPADYTDHDVAIEVQFVGFISQLKQVSLVPGANIFNFQLKTDVFSIKPIIVNAQRREENLQNVPVAITAMENRDLKNRGIDRVIDLQYSVPNFFLGDGTFNTRATSSIRGIAGATFASGVETRANYYIDDVYLGRSIAANMDLFDLQRIEILKGPQGTLFGKNTVSGVINITTRKPSNIWEGSLSVDGGNFNYLNSIFVFNAPVLENKLFARFSGKITQRDGFVKNVYNDKYLNGQNILAGRFQIRYLPFPDLDINFSLNAMRDHRDNRTVGIALDGPGYDAAPSPRQVSHNFDEFEYRDIFGSALNMVYTFSNNYSIKSITAFRKNKNWCKVDEDLSPDTLMLFDNQKIEDTHFTQEFRLTSPFFKSFNFISGLFYFYQTSDFMYDIITSSIAPVANNRLSSSGPVRTHSLAGYFHGNLNITSTLLLFGGLRYTYEYKKVNWDQKNNKLFINLENYTDTYSKGVFSPQIGLRYNPLDHLMLYAKTSWGYKSGGWGNFTVWNMDQLKLDPEYSVSYESGVKFSIFNNRLSINTSVFLNKFDDFQTEIWQHPPPPFDFVTLPVYTNAAKVTSKGLEIEVVTAPLHNLSLLGSFGYVDATYDEFIVASERNYTGNKLEFAPESEYNFSAEYKIPVIDIGTFSIRGDFIHKDDYYYDASNTEDVHIKGYELINGKIGYESFNGSIGIYLWGKNLSDELYMLNRAVFPMQVKYAWYGMPRTFGINVTYNFWDH